MLLIIYLLIGLVAALLRLHTVYEIEKKDITSEELILLVCLVGGWPVFLIIKTEEFIDYHFNNRVVIFKGKENK